MATLAESFLADLEDLSDDDHEEEESEQEAAEADDDGVSWGTVPLPPCRATHAAGRTPTCKSRVLVLAYAGRCLRTHLQ